MTVVTALRRTSGAVARWLTEPVPKARVAVFRTVVYLFIPADLLYFTRWVRGHGDVPAELYQPLLVGRLLPLPVPTPDLVEGVFWALLATSVLAASGRLPRLLGWTVFALYFEWMVIAMSYGKVDHDRVAFLTALAVLPTLGRARHGDRTLTEAGGWALRMVQLAVVATYFLSVFAKLRYAGFEWLTGDTLTRAVLRRGTWFAEWTVDAPVLLVVAQFGILGFELASPAVFLLPPRWRYAVVGFFYGFHLVTYLSLEIAFFPHLVAMLCFLPLERVRPVAQLGASLRRGGRGTPPAAAPPVRRAEPSAASAEP